MQATPFITAIGKKSSPDENEAEQTSSESDKEDESDNRIVVVTFKDILDYVSPSELERFENEQFRIDVEADALAKRLEEEEEERLQQEEIHLQGNKEKKRRGRPPKKPRGGGALGRLPSRDAEGYSTTGSDSVKIENALPGGARRLAIVNSQSVPSKEKVDHRRRLAAIEIVRSPHQALQSTKSSARSRSSSSSPSQQLQNEMRLVNRSTAHMFLDGIAPSDKHLHKRRRLSPTSSHAISRSQSARSASEIARFSVQPLPLSKSRSKMEVEANENALDRFLEGTIGTVVDSDMESHGEKDEDDEEEEELPRLSVERFSSESEDEDVVFSEVIHLDISPRNQKPGNESVNKSAESTESEDSEDSELDTSGHVLYLSDKSESDEQKSAQPDSGTTEESEDEVDEEAAHIASVVRRKIVDGERVYLLQFSDGISQKTGWFTELQVHHAFPGLLDI